MMSWVLLFLILASFRIFAWDSRNIKEGPVEIIPHEVSRAERPILFWFVVMVNLFGMAGMVFCLILWGADYNGIRSTPW